jgi:hypothetical protein
MRQRLSIAALMASAAIALAAGAALAKQPPVGAGGWATVTLDPATSAQTAGKGTTVGFTLLQRGETPISQGTVMVEATGPDGQLLSFPARSDGKIGHWVVEMNLPSAGAWEWAVTMPDELPVLTRLPALTVTAPAAPPATTGSVLPLILVLVAALAVCLLVALRGGMRTIAWRALQRLGRSGTRSGRAV